MKYLLVYILTLGATGLTILSALGIAQLAKDAKDTFNNEVLKIFNVGQLEIVKDSLDIVLNQNIGLKFLTLKAITLSIIV